ncbi:hypothetical protein RJ640_030030, partial [Escallonia rubra]
MPLDLPQGPGGRSFHRDKRSTSNTVALNSTHQDNLSSPNGQDALGVDQAWVAQVVKSTLAKDLSTGFEPHSLTELDTVASQQLREDTSEGSKHGPSAVDHLKLTILGKGFRVCGKASSVPAIVTRKFTSESTVAGVNRVSPAWLAAEQKEPPPCCSLLNGLHVRSPKDPQGLERLQHFDFGSSIHLSSTIPLYFVSQ